MIIRSGRLSGPVQGDSILFLASASPRRREILRSLGLRFRTLRPLWMEHPPGPNESPTRYAVGNARGKALSVLHRVSGGIAIGVDTVVVLDDAVLGKPKTKCEARDMLETLSGRTHSVVSGIAVARKPGMKVLVDSEISRVTFRQITEREVQTYVASGEPLDKAGAYAIQGRASRFVTEVSGCYLNIVGLPVCRLLVLLERVGFQAYLRASSL